MTRVPIRVRLTLAFALAMAVVLAMLGGFVYLRVGNTLLSSVDQSLRAQAREASTHARGEHGLVDPDAAGGTTLAQVFDAQGAVVRTSALGVDRLLSPADASRAAAGQSLFRTVRLDNPGGEWRVLAVRTVGTGQAVAVARSLQPRAETLNRLARELLIALPLGLLLASLAGYLLAAAALRPVEAMRRRAASITAASPDVLPVPQARDEISRLADTLNDMLARLHAAFEHERRFVADASHELRTPLALLRTELELAARRPRTHAELEDAVRAAATEAERLSRLAEDLLLIARAEQGALPVRAEAVEAGDILAAVASRFATRAAELGRSVRAEPADALVTLDPARVEQALANLVDNALAHGDGDVVLAALEHDDDVELHVTDRGPGFPDAFLERAFDRFSRADEARSRGGAGLGLSIVSLIAQAHGGDVGAANRPDGGADVWLSVPRAPSTPRHRVHAPAANS